MTDLRVEFTGRKGRLFGMALGMSILTVLTLGFYRFWMKTRVRRFLWSSIRIGGQPLEYQGDPLEKLLGFLVAVVLLAFYIGVINLILMFAGLTLFQRTGLDLSYGLSFLGLAPLIFAAQYRARVYLLARTRWRGIRFAAAAGAWGYAWRACLWWVLGLATLGILLPRGAYALEKYRTERTWLGTTRFSLNGRPWMLMRSAIWLWVALILTAVSVALMVFQDPFALGATWVPVILIGWLMVLFGLAYYRVDSFRRLTGARALGNVLFSSAARPWRIIRHYVFGGFLATLVSGLVSVPAFTAMMRAGQPDLFLGSSTLGWAQFALAAVSYFLSLILFGVFWQVFVALPNLRHYAETLTIHHAQDLDLLAQRDADMAAEAEGFAEALDIGAAI